MTSLYALKKYQAVVRVGISKSMEYRTNFISNSFLWLVITVFVQVCLWQAVYASSDGQIAGSPKSQMMLYIICASICLSLTYSGKIERQAAEEIRNGELNKYLLKPISHLLYTFSASIADRAFAFSFIVLLSVAIGIPATLSGTITLTLSGSLIALGFVLFAVILRFLMSMIISYLAFWMDETWTFHVVLDISLWFLSGMMLPMSILPAPVKQVTDILPFQYLAYIPAGFLSGQLPISSAFGFAGIGASWILILYGITLFIWRRGVIKFGAYGG
ncbi:MAG: ABC-2 family transporter protein [Bacteroidetes bacterium]|nr:ABC-2 family transporter protein [Bacteroidota bacterium]